MKKITFTVRQMLLTSFLVVDLFCGAGGTTTGFANTNGLVRVIGCVNHDAKAIKSHWLNHPGVKHFNEDIRTLDLTELIALVEGYRKLYPNAKIILWASLECTNFSKAKGGQPRDADSRTLADHLDRYVVALNPEIIMIENVVEFMSWGPLDENGKPISKLNGLDWERWRKEICAHGYFDEWKQLNSADFGAYTSRNRLFGMFAKEQAWINWPKPTHFKKLPVENSFGSKWKPVREVLDFEDEGNSIFGRKKDLSPKTYERIYAGLKKYVAGGDDAFIAKYFSGRPAGKVTSINNPAGTLTTSANQSLIQPCFLTKYHGNGRNLLSIEGPASTLSTKDRLAKIQAVWLDKQYSGKDNHQSINSPAGSILANDKHSLIHAEKFIVNANSSTAPSVGLNNPCPTITQRTHYLVKASKFIMNTNYNNVGSSIDSPAQTLTASRRHHYIINPQWGINGNGSVDKPCCTIIARQDKAPLHLVTAESGDLAIQVFETDPPIMVKVKEFMAAFGIIDIKMRMLKIPELLKIQGFPSEYQLFGNQADQKKFIGNSVHPLVPEHWIYAIMSKSLAA